jgi:DNA-binding CsgD family transcriptional regulator
LDEFYERTLEIAKLKNEKKTIDDIAEYLRISVVCVYKHIGLARKLELLPYPNGHKI